MNRISRIEKILREALSPSVLKIEDNSHLHAGHFHNQNPGASGGTHLRLTITDEKLSSMTRIEAHRLINSLLRQEFDTGLHAFEIILKH